MTYQREKMAMLIQVSGKGFEPSAELRDEVVRSMAAALDRFSSRIGRISVYLEDENGPKNGCDKSLRVMIDVERVARIIVQEKGEVWHSMLDRTAERAAFTVSRQIDRSRTRTDRTILSRERDEEDNWGMDDDSWNPLRRPPYRDEER